MALRPDELLPAERDLSKQLDISRPSLREALLSWRRTGLLRAGCAPWQLAAAGAGELLHRPSARHRLRLRKGAGPGRPRRSCRQLPQPPEHRHLSVILEDEIVCVV